MQKLHILPALLLALVLSACASLTAPPPPDTPVELLGWVEATRAGVARSATEALTRGRIDVDTAEDIDAQLDRVRDLADEAAMLLAAGQQTDGKATLALAQDLLLALEARLAEEVPDE